MSTYLDFYLEPIRRYLQSDEVTDLYVNRPCEIWIESLGGKIVREDDPALTSQYLWGLANQVAARSNQGISREHPLLAAMLNDRVRVQFVAPPATRGSMGVAFRRHLARSTDISEYGDEYDNGSVVTNAGPKHEQVVSVGSHTEALQWAVRARKNIVISGGTSTGKTTLLNSLLALVPQEERIVVIEDTAELRLIHPNSLGLIAVRGLAGEAAVSTLDLLEASLRMRPDRILLGELRGAEAFTFLRAINTGHPGSMTTVHSDSAHGAIRQLAMMALQANVGIRYEDLVVMISDMVDVIVQMSRVDGRRRITEVIVRGSNDESAA